MLSTTTTLNPPAKTSKVIPQNNPLRLCSVHPLGLGQSDTKNSEETVPFSDISHDLEAFLQSLDEKDRLVGKGEIFKLLQPKHIFFSDKQGKIVNLSYYKHDDTRSKFLCYPRVKTQHRLNPYRQKQLSRQNVARVDNSFTGLIDAYHLDPLKLAIIEFGCHTKISEYLSCHKNGRQLAWVLFNRFRDKYITQVDERSRGLAYRANLHTWSSEEPNDPFYHFHTHIPNIVIVQDDSVLDQAGQPAYHLENKPWHRQRGGKLVPYNEQQVEFLKYGWRKTQLDFARRHGLKLNKLAADGKANVHVRYDDPSIPLGRARYLHNLAYFGRNPIVDYAEYTIKHPECEPPLECIQNYDNRTRVGGWLSDIKKLLPESSTRREKQKISPFTNEPMSYIGKASVEGFLLITGDDIGYLDFVKGKPYIGNLTPGEVERFKQLQYYPNERPPLKDEDY
ncbi:hypothetical protein ES703_104710 [subsurface metagenome]